MPIAKPAFKVPKDCGGYPDVRECLKCGHRWYVPVSGEKCPWCEGAQKGLGHSKRPSLMPCMK